MVNETQFRRAKLARRYQWVKAYGSYVGSRLFEGYHVHLYQMEDFYAEVWFRLGLEHIVYIEVLGNPEVLNDYLENIDLKKDFGL